MNHAVLQIAHRSPGLPHAAAARLFRRGRAPHLQSLYLSLFEWEGIFDPVFVGLGNY